jgi:hypothetical protein
MDHWIHHLDQPTNRSVQPTRVPSTARAPCWPMPPPPGASRTPTVLPTPHAHDSAQFSHCRGSLSHFDKASAIFQFWPVILLHCCYNSQPFLLQCLIILSATVLSHFSDLSHSLLLQCSPFSTELHCSVIFATMLKHFSELNHSSCYSAKSISIDL